ncbi:multiple inositol polyphosphate phosphatase 1 [Solenopsis invicta]|uniref:multiple inositol polyphosphate phosphatase 1 n=1 Tax=Solenopsis invicta TaxID=13686 RepID=UPI00193E76F4|nr:multiple inositol polyphosphate phosphatase 1 [Solenopsis invicta]
MSRTSSVCRSYNKYYPYTGTITPYYNVYTSSEEPITLTSIPAYANHSDTWQTCPEFVRGNGLHLSRGGEIDMATLGERIRAKLTRLFDRNGVNNFEFRSTASKRGVGSMIAFVKGVFNVSLSEWLPNEAMLFSALNMTEHNTRSLISYENTWVHMEIGPGINDTLLKPYDTCAPWKEETNREMEAFVNGPEMTKVFDDVARRMKIPRIYKTEKVSLLYDICRFERTVCPIKPSPWCDMFTEDEMKALEYEEDLQFYYDAGPGDTLNSQLGCHLIRDMFERFTKLEMNQTQSRHIAKQNGVFYFAHSHMITMFLSALGIGKDSVPLTATNFRDMSNRSWRISRLVPFNANIAAVFHRCNTSEAPFRVTFYLNEYPLTLEGCKNGVCDWAQLKKKFDTIAANCTPNICRKN